MKIIRIALSLLLTACTPFGDIEHHYTRGTIDNIYCKTDSSFIVSIPMGRGLIVRETPKGFITSDSRVFLKPQCEHISTFEIAGFNYYTEKGHQFGEDLL